MRKATPQPPQEFVNGILIQEYLKLHPLTAEQIEKKNREGLLKEIWHTPMKRSEFIHTLIGAAAMTALPGFLPKYNNAS